MHRHSLTELKLRSQDNPLMLTINAFLSIFNFQPEPAETNYYVPSNYLLQTQKWSADTAPNLRIPSAVTFLIQ